MSYSYSQVTPDYVINRAHAERELAAQRYEQAKARIPARYHDFMILLDQHIRVSNVCEFICPEGRKAGLWTWPEKGTYVTVQYPYVTVDGRVQMARDEHRELKKRLDINEPIISDDNKLMTIVVESEIFGKSVGTIEIGLDGKGVDRVNPYANAQTSSLGRALGFLGYGLIGTGMASAEEIQAAQQSQEQPPVEAKESKDQNQTDTEREESESPKEESSPAKKEEPKPISLIMLSEPSFNKDGSTRFQAKTKKGVELEVLIPGTHKSIMEAVHIGQTIKVAGFAKKQRGKNVFRGVNNGEIQVIQSEVNSYEVVVVGTLTTSESGEHLFTARIGNKPLVVYVPTPLLEKATEFAQINNVLTLKGTLQDNNLQLEDLTVKKTVN